MAREKGTRFLIYIGSLVVVAITGLLTGVVGRIFENLGQSLPLPIPIPSPSSPFPVPLPETIPPFPVPSSVPSVSPSFPTPALEPFPPTIPQSELTVNYGPLLNYFFIEGERFEKRRSYNSDSGYATFLTFIVEARDLVDPPPFYVKYYDLERVEYTSQYLFFEPDYSTWNHGQRSRVYIELLPNTSGIEITQSN